MPPEWRRAKIVDIVIGSLFAPMAAAMEAKRLKPTS
jgi:hypothetical protein